MGVKYWGRMYLRITITYYTVLATTIAYYTRMFDMSFNVCYNGSMRRRSLRQPISASWTWDSVTAKAGAQVEKLIQRRLANLLRQRICHALKRGQKAGSAVKDLGCSVRELAAYLEERFSPGMNWGNHGVGSGRWSIDHITPLSSVDLTDRTQFLLVSHYSNLQPLWFADNVSKGAKV